MVTLMSYLLIGIIAGILSGLFGVGGGIIVVPALVMLFKYTGVFSDSLIMHMATGTSLAIMIFTASSSAYAYYKRGFIVWPLFLRILPGLCVGMLTGALIGRSLSNNALIALFAVFIILVAIYLFFSKTKEKEGSYITAKSNSTTSNNLLKLPSSALLRSSPQLPTDEWNHALSSGMLHRILTTGGALLIGMLSTTFGIGGGLLMVPFFVFLGFNVRQSSATSSICGLPAAGLGSIILIVSGMSLVTQSVAPLGTTGFVYWPAVGLVSITSVIFAPIGTSLSVRFHQKTLKRLLCILLIMSAGNLLYMIS